MVELPTAMVGDDDPVRAEGDGELRVLRVNHSFDDQIALPLVADGTDAGGGEPSAEGFVHKKPEVFHGEAGGDVGLEGGKLRNSGKQLGKRPFGTGAHLEDVTKAHLRRDR